MAKSNAQRQKEYRDRKRGGPPQGRWAGHMSAGMICRLQGISRTHLFMCRFVDRWRPDLVDLIYAGKMKIRQAYWVAKQTRDKAIANAILEERGE